MYRKIIPLLAARHRVIAMFFIGFGRSNKFTDAGEYTFQLHHDTLVTFIKILRLDQITLVGLDGVRTTGCGRRWKCLSGSGVS